MSHFTVLVIGGDPEKQLAPFNEGIEVPEHVIGEVSQEEIDNFIDYYTKESSPNRSGKKISKERAESNKSVPFPTLYAVYGRDWNGWCWKLINEKWMEVSVSNPESKWDWYLLGGRWYGYFKVHDKRKAKLGKKGIGDYPPTFDADQTTKSNINFEYMKANAQWEAMERYQDAMAIIGHLPRNRSWETIRREYRDIDRAREVYGNQIRVKAAAEWENSNGDGRVFLVPKGVDEFLIDEDTYIGNAGRDYLTTFAVLKDGKWYERGKMGWWACVSDKISAEEWDAKFNELMADLPDDTLLSVYDCHI